MAQKKKKKKKWGDYCITVDLPTTNFTLEGVTFLFTYSNMLLWGKECFSLNLVTAQY